MQIPDPLTIDMAAEGIADRFATVPAGPGILALEVEGRVTHLSATSSLRRRSARLQRTVLQVRATSFGTGEAVPAAAVLCWAAGSKLHSSLLLYQLVKRYFPDQYRKRLHLRLPWFTTLLTSDRYPRLVVSNRIQNVEGLTVGPFATRELAQLYEREVQSAFGLRRCIETLAPHPGHPGCIYGEIKQCLRPCQCAVDDARYLAEVQAAAEVFSDGRQALRKAEAARDQAIAATDFETAAGLHKHVEKLKTAVAARDPVVVNAREFHGLAVVPDRRSNSTQCFPMFNGLWQNPMDLADAPENGGSHEYTLRAGLASASGAWPAWDEDECAEHLAVFSRWYYSSWRDGSWVPIKDLRKIPYGRIIQAVKHVASAGMSKKTEVSPFTTCLSTETER